MVQAMRKVRRAANCTAKLNPKHRSLRTNCTGNALDSASSRGASCMAKSNPKHSNLRTNCSRSGELGMSNSLLALEAPPEDE
eukprot:1769255-Rhodomonas_salina.1